MFPWENLQNIHICAVSLVRDVVTYRETECLCLLRNFPHTCWFFLCEFIDKFPSGVCGVITACAYVVNAPIIWFTWIYG